MFLVMPSDPTTDNASEYLTQRQIAHHVMPIPEELGYKTGATKGIYLQGDNLDKVMLDLSANGFIIMRVFKEFEIC